MIEEVKKQIQSKELALKLYDRWVRNRQKRDSLEIPTDETGLKKLGLKNFVAQLVEPRRKHLTELKGVGKEMSTADKVALLVMLELPVVETSTLLHRLSRQLAEDPESVYFSKVNQNENCGSGCG
jgi:hypothetical protein